MWLLLIPILLLAMILLAVGGAIAAIFGALGSLWPLLLVAWGLWMLFGDPRKRLRHEWAPGAPDTQSRHARQGNPRPAPNSVRRASVQAASTTPAPVGISRLPVDVETRIAQIRHKVDELLTYADRFPPFSHDLYLVRQTASQYLPATIDAYQSLPAAYSNRPVAGTGRTSLDELRGQLDLLDGKLDEIAKDLERQDLSQLLANRQFLEARFSSRQGKALFTHVPTEPSVA